MKKQYEFIEAINRRIKNMEDGEVAALFLVSVETGDGWELEKGGTPNASQVKKTLSRFFRETDIIAHLKNDQFIVFLQGKITEEVVRGKANMLCDALKFAEEEFSNVKLTDRIGIYFFKDSSETFFTILEKASYAAELARMDASERYYLQWDPQIEQLHFWGTAGGSSVQSLESCTEDNVRVLEVGTEIKPLYSGPEHSVPCQVYPADQEAYDTAVKEAVQKGEAECRCRVSEEGAKWVPCRFRLLRLTPESTEPSIVLELMRNPFELKRQHYREELYQEWLRFVLKHSDFLLWDVDIQSRQFRMFFFEGQNSQPFISYDNFPESLIKNGRVHEDSANDFRKFAKDMLEGNPGDSANFILRHRKTNAYGWCSMAYKMVFDEKGRPFRALGIKESLSEFSEGQAAAHRSTIPESIYSHLYCYLQANLTTDTVEKLQVEGIEKSRQEEYQCYTDLLKNRMRSFFSHEEKPESSGIQWKFGRKRLLSAFGQGQRWVVERVRYVDTQGRIRRGLSGANLSKDESTGDIVMYAYLCSIDEKWNLETGLPFSVLKEAETELWEKESVRAAVRHMMGRTVRFACAVAMIRIEGLEGLFMGQRKKTERTNLGAAFSVFLGSESIACWQTEDSILAVLPGNHNRMGLLRKMQSVLSSVRLSLKGVPEIGHLRFIAAIICTDGTAGDYDQILEAAGLLCQLHSTDATDTVVFPEGDKIPVWNSMKLSDIKPDELLEEQEKTQNDLTEEEKDEALECMSILLKSGSSGNAVEQVLERLGTFYGAERAYILGFTKRDKSAAILHEWCADGKLDLSNAVYGKHLHDFPVFMRCIANIEPVFLSKKMEKKDSAEETDGEERWKYFIFPMKEKPDLNQFFCMENPVKGKQRIGLIKKMLDFLDDWDMPDRGIKGHSKKGMDSYFLFPGLRSYMDTIYSLDSNMYSAMGALAVDIARQSIPGEPLDEDYISRFELRTSEILTDIFGKNLLFHTQRAEFVVLCADTTYEAFVTRCSRVRELLEKQFAGLSRMGYTWSDGVFNARDLVDKARNLMYCGGTYESGASEWSLIKKEKLPLRAWGVKERQPIGKFTIYLQPKIDMRTGALAGAEALVRVMDSDGDLLPHGKIIDSMEKEGTIQELDYFVFDRALSVLSQWEKKDYKIFPISTNFSRKTLLNPTALASLLAILSRYPEVPLDKVEMEITETGGDFESNTFSDLIDNFQEYGFQFSLDDFGSRYSNMSMLSDIHFHTVKLDRSMVRGVVGNQISQMMIKNIGKCQE